jgi:hypothetical protein
LNFSFTFCCDPDKMVNMKVAPNVLIYLLEMFSIFQRSLAISFDLIFEYVIIVMG